MVGLVFVAPDPAADHGPGSHLFRAQARQTLDHAQSIRWVLRKSATPPDKPGKYPLLQKLFHHGAALVVLTAVVTGGLMMVKIDTPLWARDPYWLASQTWGVIYVLHGLASLLVLALVMVHIYFAIRPEKLWITRSMIVGWIRRDEYHANHDPALWPESAEMRAGPRKRKPNRPEGVV